MISTRTATQISGQFVRDTPGSQALERGLILLRAFRVGVSCLTNAGLAERSGLPRPTVSRLTRTLVDAGFLAYDVSERAYRLTPVVLSLSDAFGQANQAPEFALPFMRKVGSTMKVNVGIAIAEQTDMVYLASVRESHDSISRLRRVAPGTRVPIETASIGIAYLAGLTEAARNAILDKVAQRNVSQWASISERIVKGIGEWQEYGYCSLDFQRHHLLAVGSHFYGPDGQLYAVNISYPYRSKHEPQDKKKYAATLLKLIAEIKNSWLKAYESKGMAIRDPQGSAKP